MLKPLICSRMPNSMTARNGGWGWFVVASAHISTMMWDGDTKALAVLLPTLKEQFATQTWMMGWLIGMKTTVMDLTGKLKKKIES